MKGYAFLDLKLGGLIMYSIPSHMNEKKRELKRENVKVMMSKEGQSRMFTIHRVVHNGISLVPLRRPRRHHSINS